MKHNRIYSFLTSDIYMTRLVGLLVLWMIFMGIFSDRFFNLITFQTMAAQFPEFGLMALGIMLCMITGGIDLSVVGVANLASISSAMLLNWMTASNNGILSPFGIFAAILLGVLIGVAAGIINGVLVSKVKIPPILATLGSMQLYTGIAIVLTEGRAVPLSSPLFTEVLRTRIFDLIPTQLVFFLVMAVLIQFLLTRTTYGTKLYMLGTNSTAAKFSGLNTDRLLIKTYMLSGICAAVGGMVMLANYNTARADFGAVYTLQSILIVVLGGVSPMGGKGKMGGVILAICVLQMFSSGLNRFPQINAFFIPLIWGSILIIVMVLNYFTENKKIKHTPKRL